MSTVPLMLPYGQQSRLELEIQGDVFIQEIVAEVSDRYNPGPGPGPGPGGRAVHLQLNQNIKIIMFQMMNSGIKAENGTSLILMLGLKNLHK
jgi:hypothetical protein